MRYCILILAWVWSLGLGAQTRGDSVFSSLQPDRLTLLVFYDPDCAECRQELFALKRSHRESLPKSWQVVMADGGIDGYDLSAMPAIYLLDADRKVMMHNPTVPQLSALLESLWQNP